MSNPTETHSPLPWSHRLDFHPPEPGIVSANGGLVCSVRYHGNLSTITRTGQEFSHADARLIVQTCNHHNMLVAALERAEQFIRNGIEYGYIDEPKVGQPEAATLGIISHAIAQATAVPS